MFSRFHTNDHVFGRLGFPGGDWPNVFHAVLSVPLDARAGDLVSVNAETIVVNDGYKRHAFVGSCLVLSEGAPIEPVDDKLYTLGKVVSAVNGENISPRSASPSNVYLKVAKSACFEIPVGNEDPWLHFVLFARSNGATGEDSLSLPGGTYGQMSGFVMKKGVS